MNASEAIDMPIIDAALAYRAAGLSVIATRGKVYAGGSTWSPFKSAPADEEQIADMFLHAMADQVAVVCGAVSGSLECMDFDNGGEAYGDWRTMVEGKCSGLVERCVIERSPSGGFHVVYRCPETAIPGSQKLAVRPTGEQGAKQAVLIETRGEGAYFVCAPSPGYEFVQGEIAAVPEITPDQRDILLACAKRFDERPAPTTAADKREVRREHDQGALRPGDDYNRRGNVRELLTNHGWRHTMTRGPNEHWLRPGKTAGKTSATLRHVDGMDLLYVFTTSTAFESEKALTPFQVFSHLEHNGDFSAASGGLRRLGYGDGSGASSGVAVANVTPQDGEGLEEWSEPLKPSIVTGDPGPFPQHLFKVPPALADIVAYIDRNAIKPQPLFNLAAAIAFAGTLLGRRVETESGLRTNFYILAIGPSGSGKESPRQSLKALLSATDSKALGADDLASETGLLRALDDYPVQLFLIDEFGRHLRALASPKAGNHLAGISAALLKLFSSANCTTRPKAYADSSRNFTLHQPHAVLFGTSVAESVYDALTVESVSDGFLARLLVFETETPEPARQNPVRTEVPQTILDVAKKWMRLSNTAELSEAMWLDAPMVKCVKASGEAMAIYDALEERAAKVRQSLGDNPEAALWNRTREHAEKLALVHACAEGPDDPFIGQASATWGSDLSEWLTAKSVYRANGRIADNPFHAKILKCMGYVRQAGAKGVSRQQVIRKMKCPARDLDQYIEALAESRQVELVKVRTDGRTSTVYRECRP